jgi:superfamily II DNA or RNA helicase
MKQRREYQSRAIEWALTEPARRKLVVSPTGTGKTFIGAEIVREARVKNPNARVLWVAHRRELVQQGAEALGTDNILSASIKTDVSNHPVCVASIQTLMRRKEVPRADLLVIDEAHHTPAKTWELFAREYSNIPHVGLTATPIRQDNRSMGEVFDSLHVAIGTDEAIESGYLCPLRIRCPAGPRGNLAADPAEVVNSVSGRCVIFARDIEHAEKIGQQTGGKIVTSRTPTQAREGILASKPRVLINVNALTEGWDDPEVEAAILCRPVGSTGLFVQIVGRILRLHPNKSYATLFDLCGTTHKLGWPTKAISISLESGITLDKSYVSKLKYCPNPLCRNAQIGGVKCQVCGTKLGASKEEIAIRKEEMIELSRAQFEAKSLEDKKIEVINYHKKLTQQADINGYHSGWIKHRLIAKYPNALEIANS